MPPATPRPLLFDAREARIEALDALPRSLWLGGLTLNVTMMGMPAVNPGSFTPPPESRPAKASTGSRVPVLVAGGVLLALLAYFFLFQG
jgi:hypothetical protein